METVQCHSPNFRYLVIPKLDLRLSDNLASVRADSSDDARPESVIGSGDCNIIIWEQRSERIKHKQDET